MVSYAYTNVTPVYNNNNKKVYIIWQILIIVIIIVFILQDEIYEMCPVGELCADLGGDCLKCDMTPNCVYGASYTANCTVPEPIDCVVNLYLLFYNKNFNTFC